MTALEMTIILCLAWILDAMSESWPTFPSVIGCGSHMTPAQGQNLWIKGL